MVRSKKTVVVSFLGLALLVGCGDNEPSKSDIKKQISAQLSPCPELSISDFQKINGYPQTDGSYIDQIQYTLTFTPSDEMLSLLPAYDKSKKASSIGDQNAQDTYDQQVNEDNALRNQADRDRYNLELALQHDCPINTSDGGVLSLLNVGDDPDDFVKTFSVQMSGSVHLVKSDNGWVIQN